jgi:hypothetical protein
MIMEKTRLAREEADEKAKDRAEFAARAAILAASAADAEAAEARWQAKTVARSVAAAKAAAAAVKAGTSVRSLAPYRDLRAPEAAEAQRLRHEEEQRIWEARRARAKLEAEDQDLQVAYDAL